MYCVVGKWNKYVWVYDTNDGSCEIISDDDFMKMKESGVGFIYKKDRFGFKKLMVLCNMPGFNMAVYLPILSYNLYFHFAKSCTFHTVGIGVYIFKTDCIVNDNPMNMVSMYKEYGYSGEYLIFLQVDTDVLRYPDGFRSITVKDELRGGYHNYRGLFFIPPYQLVYLFKIGKNKDLDALKSATYGFCFEQLIDKFKIITVQTDVTYDELYWYVEGFKVVY